jgi:hypothetical protein
MDMREASAMTEASGLVDAPDGAAPARVVAADAPSPDFVGVNESRSPVGGECPFFTSLPRPCDCARIQRYYVTFDR